MPKRKAGEEPIHEKVVLTCDLAAVVGKSDTWIRNLTRDGVLKQVSRGKYVLGESVQAYIEHVAGAEDKPRLNDERAALTAIKKENAEIDLRKKRGELHETREIEKRLATMVVTAKTKLQAIAPRIAPQLVGESAARIEQLIAAEINAALMGLSRDLFAEDEDE